MVIPEVLKFPDIFEFQKTSLILEFSNNSRRPYLWKFELEEEYKEIFFCKGATNGTLSPGGDIFLHIEFRPRTAVTFKTEAFLYVDGKMYSVWLIGTGIAPLLTVNSKGQSFGVVGVGEPEVREIELKNESSLPLHIRIKTDNDSFIPVEGEVRIEPGNTELLHVMFAPTAINRYEHGIISLYHIGDLLDGSDEIQIDSSKISWQGILNDKGQHRSISDRPELKELNDFNFDGTGGQFGFQFAGDGVEIIEEGNLENSFTGPHYIPPEGKERSQITNINLNFGNITGNKKYKKAFDVENSGDTRLEFEVLTLENRLIRANTSYICPNHILKYSISPDTATIPPQTKEKVTITVEVSFF